MTVAMGDRAVAPARGADQAGWASGAVALRLAPIPVALLALTLILPTSLSFYAGALRLSPYRIALILLFIPVVVRLLTRAQTRFSLVDGFITLHAVLVLISLSVNEGMDVAIESGGVQILELCGAYLVGRACVRSMATFNATVGLLAMIVLCIMPFVVFESLTGRHVIREVSDAMVGYNFSSAIDTRFGLHRAFGPMDHPILWGVLSASLLGMVSRLPPRVAGISKYVLIGATAIAAMTSLSAGAAAALMTQFFMLAWARLTRGVQARWWIFVAGVIAMYIMADILSNRSGIKVFLSYLTFSPATAYNRLIIWEWGFYHNVLVHPWFGIGFDVWTRPTWMHSTSMDNFWLLETVRFGVPAFLGLAGATIAGLVLGRRAGEASQGWAISMIGLILAGCTVHFWNNSFVWFGLILGIGGVFFDPPTGMFVRRSPQGKPAPA